MTMDLSLTLNMLIIYIGINNIYDIFSDSSIVNEGYNGFIFLEPINPYNYEVY